MMRPKRIPPIMRNIFFTLSLLLWYSSKISNVVMCSNIPDVIASKFTLKKLNQFWSCKNMPASPPSGLIKAKAKNNIRAVDFLIFAEIKKSIKTIATGILCETIAQKKIEENAPCEA